jgi:Homeodomain-like domain
MSRASFDMSSRQRFLALYDAGKTIEQAAVAVGVSRTTVATWRARGAEPDAPAEAAEFARNFAAMREGRTNPSPSADDGGPPLTLADVRRLLERSARGGSVTAQRILLSELRREQEAREREELLQAMGIEDPLGRL